jgi:hypothetical protein
MQDDNTGKVVKERAKPRPKWVTVGKYEVLSNARWSNPMMAEWIILHGANRWVTLGELARKVYMSPSIPHKDNVRRCLSKWFTYILKNHRRLLVVDYAGEHGAATQVKIYDPAIATKEEHEGIEAKLQKMRKLRTISNEQIGLAEEILELRKLLPPTPSEAGKGGMVSEAP